MFNSVVRFCIEHIELRRKLVIVFDGKIFPLHFSSSFKKQTLVGWKEHALYGCANLSWDNEAKERRLEKSSHLQTAVDTALHL